MGGTTAARELSAVELEAALAERPFVGFKRLEELVWSGQPLAWLVFWTCLFYFLVFTKALWLDRLPKSSKTHERSVYWNCMQVSSLIHSTVIAVISAPALFMLALQSTDYKFPPESGGAALVFHNTSV